MSEYAGKLVIYLPTRGSYPWEFFGTYNALQKPPDTLVKIEPGVYEIGRARNSIVEDFLETDREYMLMLDDDQVFPFHDSIIRLLNHDLDVISGLYFKRRPPFSPILMFKCQTKKGVRYRIPYKETDYPRNQLLKVDAVPTGFLLVKRHVLESIKPPWFVSHEDWGEDVDFSCKATEAGYNLWVDTSIVALHMAYLPIGPAELVEAWWRRMVKEDLEDEEVGAEPKS